MIVFLLNPINYLRKHSITCSGLCNLRSGHSIRDGAVGDKVYVSFGDVLEIMQVGTLQWAAAQVVGYVVFTRLMFDGEFVWEKT